MATQQEKNRSYNSKKNAAHGLRFIWSGIEDIYYAEKILSKTLPKMAKMLPLRIGLLNKHLKETNEHISRLEKIFEVTVNQLQKMWCDGRDILKSDDMINKTDQGIVHWCQFNLNKDKTLSNCNLWYFTRCKTMGEKQKQLIY
jgi:hypothetical protein